MGARVGAQSELDVGKIEAQLDAATRARIARLDLALEIDSTNSELLRRSAPPAGQASVLLAERQTAGRGRRGRTWLAAPGEVLCLSIGWAFAPPLPDLSALSLAIGVCCAQALQRVGIDGVALKWPNDLIAAGGKLGGILIETRTEPGEGLCVVIGVGINLALSAATRAAILAFGTDPADLKSLAGAQTGVSANLVATRLIESILEGTAQFARAGFGSFVAAWNARDCLRARPVLVRHANGETHGVARGIDSVGALLIDTPHGPERFLSGEVSVRGA